MAATARMILQVDPVEKARWTAAARKAGISTSEFVRRAAAAPEVDPELILTREEAELIRGLSVELKGAAGRMAENLDALGAGMRRLTHYLSDPELVEARRSKVRVDVRAADEYLDFLGPSGAAA